MLGNRDNKRGGASKRGGSKELQHLRRQDLLELLVSQMHEADDLRAMLTEREQTIAELEQLTDRLKGKLDAKDEQQENLKTKLDLKDEQISRLKDKLDEKDALIERLKHRLDAKYVLVTHLIDGEVTVEDELAIFEMRERALEAIEAEKSRRVNEDNAESARYEVIEGRDA